MNEAWLDDPQSAANHMAFGMDLKTPEKKLDKSKVRHQSLTGFLNEVPTYTGGRVDLLGRGMLISHFVEDKPSLLYTNIR